MARISTLHPNFTWHATASVAKQQQTLKSCSQVPPPPPLAPRFLRVICAKIHIGLLRFSKRYCQWYGINYSGQIARLPFGLLLKWSDGTRLEEVRTMKMMYEAGIPIPRVISYAEHVDTPHAPVSILMTRMPGTDLSHGMWEWLGPDQKKRFTSQLRSVLGTMRGWTRTLRDDEPAICPVSEPCIRSIRVPEKVLGPFQNEKDFNDALIAPALPDYVRAEIPQYDEKMAKVERLPSITHDIKFTHGDFMPHNILVLKDGRISALLDWEASGWLPSYWEYSTAKRLSRRANWWTDIVEKIADANYDVEREGDLARWLLIIDFISW